MRCSIPTYNLGTYNLHIISVVILDLGTFHKSRTRLAKFKCFHNLFIIDPKDLVWEFAFFVLSDLTLLSSFKLKQEQPKLRVLISAFLLVLEYFDLSLGCSQI